MFVNNIFGDWGYSITFVGYEICNHSCLLFLLHNTAMLLYILIHPFYYSIIFCFLT